MAPQDTSRLDSIEHRVRRLVVACIVPAWLAASLIAFFAGKHEQEGQIAATVQRARVLMQQVERELALSIGALQTLATSPSIDDKDLARFHSQAAEVTRNVAADNIVWFDSPVHVVLSAAHPLSMQHPTGVKDRFPGLFTKGQPAVSDLFVGQVSKRPQIAVAVPIKRAGSVIGRLDMVLTPDRFAQLISQQDFDPDLTVTIVDNQGVIVARNRDPERFVGKVAAPDLISHLHQAHEGHFDGRTSEGTRVVGCFSSSAQYGWTAAIGVPVAQLRAVLLQRLGLIALMTVLILGAGLVLARRLARRIAEPVQALVVPALAIGRGEATTLPPSTLKEAAEVSGALEQAQALLRERDLSRRIAESALEDSQSRLSMALDISRVGTWELDPNTQMVMRSRPLEECFGYRDVPPPWSLDDFLAHLHPDDRARIATDIRRLQSEPGYRSDRTECRVLWGDDSEHLIGWRAARLDEQGRRSRIVGIVIDITQERQAEALRLEQVRMEAEHRQLRESSRLKSEFLANMSHELRTPLNAIIGFADLLRMPAIPLDSPKRETYLTHIASAGRHLLNLINDVLDLSKVESGKFEFFPEPVDLAALTRDVASLMEPHAASKRIALDVEHDPAVGEVTVDPSRLKQVLLNFLSNAIKFTTEGGRVTLRSRAEDANHFRIEVEDNGVGISEADQRLLFTQFQQVGSGPSQPSGGTGLGLALSRQLVERQGGTVGLRSAPGVGSTFFLVMPRHPPGETASAPPAGSACVAEPHRR